MAWRRGDVWVARDAFRARGDYRTKERIAYGVPPEGVDQLARQHTRGHYTICAIRGLDDPKAPRPDACKGLGYRLNTTEPFMVHRLQEIPHFDCPVEIQCVTTPEVADRLNKAARARQSLSRHLNGDDTLRQYVALDGDEPVGWVRSITVEDATWCSNMYVKSDYRRRGIARALLSRVLRDDREAGARRRCCSPATPFFEPELLIRRSCCSRLVEKEPAAHSPNAGLSKAPRSRVQPGIHDPPPLAPPRQPVPPPHRDEARLSPPR